MTLATFHFVSQISPFEKRIICTRIRNITKEALLLMTEIGPR